MEKSKLLDLQIGDKVSRGKLGQSDNPRQTLEPIVLAAMVKLPANDKNEMDLCGPGGIAETKQA
jgi:hypothetical protein